MAMSHPQILSALISVINKSLADISILAEN